MGNGVQDGEIVKKRVMKRNAIIAFLFIALCGFLPFILTGTKIPLEAYIVIGGFLLIVFISLVIGIKYKDKIAQPRIQKILGYIVGGLAILQIILYLIADLLEGKISIQGLIISGIIFVCFLVLSIILIKKSKKKE